MAMALYRSIVDPSVRDPGNVIDIRVLPKGSHEAITSVVTAILGAIAGAFLFGFGNMVLIMFSETPPSILRFFGAVPVGAAVGAAVGYAFGKWYARSRLR